MREELLHFIWRNRHFHQQELVTEDGQPLQIIFPGEPNNGQGPDFRNARVRIGDRLWGGSVELHVHASDWIRHAHTGDAHYGDVILHVVWVNDRVGAAGDIPVLALATRVPKLLLSRYERWMRQPSFVPCERQLPAVDAGIRAEWIQKLVLRRLQRRAGMVRQRLESNRQDWEETTWWMMARSMGLPVNAEVFEAVARSLPLRLLRRHRQYPLTVETLLFGQAGLLTGEGAVREYRFWQGKYGLQPVKGPVSFLRMRPAHFPAARLTQLAGLLKGDRGWFSIIRDSDPVEAVARTLGEIKGLGAERQRGIVINAFVPLLFAHGQEEKALRWLGALPAERNAVLKRWAALGWVAKDAAGSQGLLELGKEYCDARRCLDCAIGRALLAN